jgi:DNA helicase-2/ATP-dependent DNA helicase PcrA
MLKTDKDPDTKTRLDNLKELVRALQEYADVSSFLEHAALVAEGQESSGEVVRISTIHAAKGLEFDTVFLPGFEDGLFPHQRVLNEEGNKGLEEERRLAYVAITRAKRKLIICYAASRLQYGQFSPCIPSRFIKELPEGSYKMFSPTYGSSAYGGAYRPAVGSTLDVKSRAHDSVKPAEPFITSSQPVVEKQADAYPLGSRVFHQKFGYGHVKTLEGKGVEQKLVIAFEKAGDKKLVAQLAGLEKV